MKKKEELHQAEMDRLKEDAARRATLFEVVKKDLEQAMQDKAKAEKQRDDALAALSVRAQNDQKLKQICEDHEAVAYKKESAKWLSELNLLDRNLDCELAEPISSLSSSSRFAFK